MMPMDEIDQEFFLQGSHSPFKITFSSVGRQSSIEKHCTRFHDIVFSRFIIFGRHIVNLLLFYKISSYTKIIYKDVEQNKKQI